MMMIQIDNSTMIEEFRSKGVMWQGVKFEHQTYGYRLICDSNIPKGKVFLSIPYTQIVNAANLENKYPQLKNLFSLHKKQLDQFGNDQLYLLLGVIYQKVHGLQGEWFKVESHTFSCFDEKLIQQTKDQMLIIEYRAFQEYCFKEFKGIYQIIHKSPDLFPHKSEKQYRDIYEWATNFIMTRGFGCGMLQTALIPFFDFLNHQPNASQMTRLCLVNCQFQANTQTYARYCQKRPAIPNSSYLQYSFVANNPTDLSIIGVSCQPPPQPLEPEKVQSDYQSQLQSQDSPELVNSIQPPYTHIVLRAQRDILAGQQIFFHYGCRNNSYLLKWYGFVVEDNPHDSLTIYLNWAQGDKIMVSLDPVERPHFEVKIKRHEISQELLAWARRHYIHTEGSSPDQHLNFNAPINLSYQVQIIKNCFSILQNFEPPCPNLTSSSGDAYFLGLYYKERLKIYVQQRQYIRECVEVLSRYCETGILDSSNQKSGIVNYLLKVKTKFSL